MQKIIPSLWFDTQAEAAVQFYTFIFSNTKIGSIVRYGDAAASVSGMLKGSVMTVDFQLEGQDFVALNGGPVFHFTPAISFFVNCDDVKEINALWQRLSEGGVVLMPLDKYPFSARFGWVQDKFGISWQLSLAPNLQKITPFLMFTGEQHFKAEEAIKFYTEILPKSDIISLNRYGPDESDTGVDGSLRLGKFSLYGQEFIAIDSHYPHAFGFTHAISFIVNCDTQEEIDILWEAFSKEGTAEQCGWVADKFGIAWQIVPTLLPELLTGQDEEETERKVAAMMKMVKFDIETLKNA